MSFLQFFKKKFELNGPPSSKHILLTKSEYDAKEYFLKLMSTGLSEPAVDLNNNEAEPQFPEKFDTKLFEKGRSVFANNCYGIMKSNLYGLHILMSAPKSLKFLESTGQTEYRYGCIVQQIVDVYQNQLKEGSDSWTCVKKVRTLIRKTSEIGIDYESGELTQFELVFAAIGFIGFTILRPELLGIKFDSLEDKKTFIYFWSVLLQSLGVQDEYNFCRFDYLVVEEICNIFNRYVFIPALQLEYPLYKKCANLLVKGMHVFTWTSSYESRLFLIKRLAGVPGYQYKINIPKGFYCKKVFSEVEREQIQEKIQSFSEYRQLREILFPEKILQLEYVKNSDSTEFALDEKYDQAGLFELFDLDHINDLHIREIDEDKVAQYLNGNQYKKLSKKDKFLVELNLALFGMAQMPVTKWILKGATLGVLSYIKFYNQYYKIH